MAMLTINGGVWDVAQGGAGQRYDMQVGSSTHSFNGGLRSAKRATKWAWPIVLGPMTQADYTSLISFIANGALVTVGGDVIGASRSAEIVVTDAAFVPDMSDPLGFRRLVSVTVIEV